MARGEEPKGTVAVLVPGALVGPVSESCKLFQQRHPNVKIGYTVDSIQKITSWAVKGRRRPDVFFSIGEREVQRVAEAGRSDGKPVTFARAELALVTAKGNPLGLSSLAEVAANRDARVALATVESSQGYHVKRALVRMGTWEQVALRTWFAAEPFHVKERVRSGKADVGIIYYTCASEATSVGGTPGKLGKGVELAGRIDPKTVPPIQCQAVVVKGCANPAAGRALLQFLATDEAKVVFGKWGFLPGR